METQTIPVKRKVGRPFGTYSYGEPISGNGVSLFDRQWAALRQIADAQRVPLAFVLRQIIDEWLAREDATP